MSSRGYGGGGGSEKHIFKIPRQGDVDLCVYFLETVLSVENVLDLNIRELSIIYTLVDLSLCVTVIDICFTRLCLLFNPCTAYTQTAYF